MRDPVVPPYMSGRRQIALRKLALPIHAKTVAWVMGTYAGPDGGSIYPKIETLMAECDLSRSAIQRAVKTLIERGLLVLVKRGGGRQSNHYRLALPDRWETKPVTNRPAPDHEPCHTGTPDVSESDPCLFDTSEMSQRHGCGVTVTPDLSMEQPVRKVSPDALRASPPTAMATGELAADRPPDEVLQPESYPKPGPAPPVAQSSPRRSTAGQTQLREDWTPNAQSFEKGRELRYSADEVAWLADDFRDFWLSNGGRKRNWDRAFNNFVAGTHAADKIAVLRRSRGTVDDGRRSGAAARIEAIGRLKSRLRCIDDNA